MHHRLLHLVVDWDGTLTRSDTLHLVAAIGYAHHGKDAKTAIPLPTWTGLSKDYLARYQAHEESYRPAVSDRRTLAEERAWLESLRAVEQWSVDEVISAGLFEGVTADEVDVAAEKAIRTGAVQLRPGWAKLLRRCVASGQVSVLSVNWSAAFIRACLLAALRRQQKVRVDCSDGVDGDVATRVQDMAIDADELVLDTRHNLLRTSADKLRLLMMRKREFAASNTSTITTSHDDQGPQQQGKASVMTVYVGDSETDLECLLAADVGICMQDEEVPSKSQIRLTQSLERLGCTVEPIEHLVTVELTDAVQHACVWAAGDFHQILDALERIQVV